MSADAEKAISPNWILHVMFFLFHEISISLERFALSGFNCSFFLLHCITRFKYFILSWTMHTVRKIAQQLIQHLWVQHSQSSNLKIYLKTVLRRNCRLMGSSLYLRLKSQEFIIFSILSCVVRQGTLFWLGYQVIDSHTNLAIFW